MWCYIMAKAWSEKEINILRTYYPGDTPIEKIMEMLPGRTYSAILHKAVHLGINKGKYIPEKRKSRRWTKEEIEIVKSYYGKVNEREIINIIPNRTASSVKSIINRLKERCERTYRPRNPTWTESELKILIENYSKLNNNELMELLPDRSYDAIRARLYILGLRRDKKSLCKPQSCRMWTDEEHNILKTNLHLPIKEIIKLLPHRSEDSIRSQRRRLKLLGEI